MKKIVSKLLIWLAFLSLQIKLNFILHSPILKSSSGKNGKKAHTYFRKHSDVKETFHQYWVLALRREEIFQCVKGEKEVLNNFHNENETNLRSPIKLPEYVRLFHFLILSKNKAFSELCSEKYCQANPEVFRFFSAKLLEKYNVDRGREHTHQSSVVDNFIRNIDFHLTPISIFMCSVVNGGDSWRNIQ